MATTTTTTINNATIRLLTTAAITMTMSFDGVVVYVVWTVGDVGVVWVKTEGVMELDVTLEVSDGEGVSPVLWLLKTEALVPLEGA